MSSGRGTGGCCSKAVMSPFSKVKVSPFARAGGDDLAAEEVRMSLREADRAGVIRRVVEKWPSQREASVRPRLSVRQVRRLSARYRAHGAAGLVSGRRGQRSNRAIAEGVRRETMRLVRERYADFGPTFACEKLVEAHGFRLSAETLRKWMMAKSRRAVRTHPSRPTTDAAATATARATPGSAPARPAGSGSAFCSPPAAD